MRTVPAGFVPETYRRVVRRSISPARGEEGTFRSFREQLPPTAANNYNTSAVGLSRAAGCSESVTRDTHRRNVTRLQLRKHWLGIVNANTFRRVFPDRKLPPLINDFFSHFETRIRRFIVTECVHGVLSLSSKSRSTRFQGRKSYIFCVCVCNYRPINSIGD